MPAGEVAVVDDAATSAAPAGSPGRGLRLGLGVVTAVLVLAATYMVGFLTPRWSAPGEGSPEAGFARDMSLHHGQAVEMAMLAYQNATDPEIRTIGYDIATTQQFQIGQMQRWLQEWRLSPTGDARPMAWMPGEMGTLLPDGRMPGMASQAELIALRSARGRDFDVLFCQLMMRHHLGGLHMAEAVLDPTDRAEVRVLAEAVLSGQQREINILNEILARLGAQP